MLGSVPETEHTYYLLGTRASSAEQSSDFKCLKRAYMRGVVRMARARKYNLQEGQCVCVYNPRTKRYHKLCKRNGRVRFEGLC